jgi:hypothetical protein
MLSCDASLIAQRRTTGRSHHEVPRSSPSRANSSRLKGAHDRTEQRARRRRPGFSSFGWISDIPRLLRPRLTGRSVDWADVGDARKMVPRSGRSATALERPPDFLRGGEPPERHYAAAQERNRLPCIVARARRVRSAPSRGEPAGPSKSPGACPNAARGMVRSCRQMASDVPPS